jgi:hypothetical protein
VLCCIYIPLSAVLYAQVRAPASLSLSLSFQELAGLEVLESAVCEALRLSSGSLIMRRVGGGWMNE